MLHNIRNLLSAPDFGNEEANRRAQLIHKFTLIVSGLLGLSLIAYSLSGMRTNTFIVLVTLLGVMLISFTLLHFRRLLLSGTVLIFTGWILIGLEAYSAEGIRDVIIIAYIAIALLSALLVGWRGTMIVMAASIAIIWLIAFAETQGLIQPAPQAPLAYARDVTVIFIVITSLVYYLTQNMRTALERANIVANELSARNVELQNLRLSLEEQVKNRTRELALTSERLEKRAQKYEAIVRVLQNTTAPESIASLVTNLTEVIHTEFGYYHVGIFLLDDDKKYASLAAANSPEGQMMLMQNYRIALESDSAIANVCKTGRTRLIHESAETQTTSLPETRSEIILPLRSGSEIFGVLDMHSKEQGAFTDADIEALNLLAGQVSYAILNARLIEETRSELEDARRTYQEYLRQERAQFVTRQPIIGYKYTQNKVEPIRNTEEMPANAQGEIVIPVILRGETLGEISIDTGGRPWNDEDYAVIRAAAERAALGLENARLIEATRQRAQIERTIADLSATIGSSTDFDAIMRMTVEELGKTLNTPEVFIRLK